MKALTRGLFLAYLLWEVRRVWQAAADGSRAVQAVVRGAARCLLVLLLLVLTWVLAWYFTWPLALAALLGWRSLLARTIVAYSLAALLVFNVHDYWYVASGGDEMPGWLLLAYALLPPLLAFGGRLRVAQPVRHR